MCCAPSPGPGPTSAAGSLPGRYWSTLSQNFQIKDSESSARLYQFGCQIPKSNASIEELGNPLSAGFHMRPVLPSAQACNTGFPLHLIRLSPQFKVVLGGLKIG